MQACSDPTREHDTHSLPDIEVFYVGNSRVGCPICALDDSDDPLHADPQSHGQHIGFYWWSCFPGCLPDGDAVGPFQTEQDALLDSQDW